jgi:hypothetical protein
MLEMSGRHTRGRNWLSGPWGLALVLWLGIAGALGGAEGLTAFPGAEGAGRWTVGGRGGRVIAVTNLRDSGPGSLRAAVEASGRRTVVFRVAGTIWLRSKLRVRNGWLTLAGQTAPGEGITVAGHEFQILAGQVIVRYLRFRPGPGSREDVDAVSVVRGRNIILDHISASWGVDETVSVTPDARDVTVQWSLISESLHRSVHSSGQPHGKGSLIRGRDGAKVSFYANLFAHHADRAPMVQGMDPVARDPLGVWLDFRNNVIYDWGSILEGWEAAGANRNREAAARYNFINNSYLTGPGTGRGLLPVPGFPFFALRFWVFEELSTHAKAHWSGNTLNGELWRNASNQPDPTWKVSIPAQVAGVYFLSNPVTFSGATPHTRPAGEAEALVRAGAGASLRRDPVDLRVIRQVAERSGGLVHHPDEVGGWPALAGGPVPPDRDGDGLPDDWERARGLNPANAADGARQAPDGRTWLEHFHDELARAEPLVVTVSSAGHGTASGPTGGLARGGMAPLTLDPAPGWEVEELWLNGRRWTGALPQSLGPLWTDTTVHAVFARRRIPMPPEHALPHVAMVEDLDAGVNGLGGRLHFRVTRRGMVTGRLQMIGRSRVIRSRVIAREGVAPSWSQEWTAGGAAWSVEARLAGDGTVSGEVTRDGVTSALTGWASPWNTALQPLPPPLPGPAGHSARLPRVGGDGAHAHAEDQVCELRLVLTRGGLTRARARFSDGRAALSSSRLSGETHWMFWAGLANNRARAAGQGTLVLLEREDAPSVAFSGEVRRLVTPDDIVEIERFRAD